MDDDNAAPDWDWKVLRNHEGQYSLWPAVNDIPAGWNVVGPTGTKSDCLAYVEANWTDMRPLSLRTT